MTTGKRAASWNHVGRLDRRDWLTAVLGSSIGTAVGCRAPRLPTEGELLSPNFSMGHLIRDQAKEIPSSTKAQRVDVVIVGGGVAGLSAARQLQRQGIDDFLLLEMESKVGGTARSGTTNGLQHPWGAHYVPVPMASNHDLIELLQEMDVVTGLTEDGSPIVAEQYLCRDPEERVFVDDQWYPGLYPFAGASDADRTELDRFRQHIDHWVGQKDSQGRRAFTIPCSQSGSHVSDENELLQLDQQSMAAWMQASRLTSPRLRWLIEHSCRDDYGSGLEQTSALAGLYYFASRVRTPGSESQDVITWPEGNGRIVRFLHGTVGERIHRHQAVMRIVPTATDDVRVDVLDVMTGEHKRIQAKRVIIAAPQFIAKHLIVGFDDSRVKAASRFEYGSWVVANVHLNSRPAESGFPPCWDNVAYGSRSLGYVSATHQLGQDHGPTVLTWYYPLSAVDPAVSRKELLSLDWSHWADFVLSELSIPHPEISDLVTRLDIMRWGHAMVMPTVGFITHPDRKLAQTPYKGIHFAASDLSGVALMEEAFDHGNRAAREVSESLHVGSTGS